MKLWHKGYKLDTAVERYTVGNDYLLDRRLVKYDCEASIAHARMLKKTGILNVSECKRLVSALNDIIRLDAKGIFVIKPEDEDCHTAIEKHLVKKLGPLGKKIHTARSRNDQVLTALRLYYRKEIKRMVSEMGLLRTALQNMERRNRATPMPGYTHMRKAMPSSPAMWARAFADSLWDDRKLFEAIARIINQSPLGTGAGYGLPISVDRKLTARLLKFRCVQESPIYAQHSRGKFESWLLHAINQVMYDLNKMAMDIILFSMPEFGYFILPDRLCTGSSIMPHKKNPDVLELVRARYSTTLALEFEVKRLIANLPSGYNRDLQLTKEPVMRAFDILHDSIDVMTLVITGLKVDENKCKMAMTEELYSVEKVHRLVRKNVPFRDAYRSVSKKY